MNKGQGLFIVIEGLDGSGLSTQTRLVVDLLRQQGVKAFPTKEPTNNVVGGLIRGVLSGITTFPLDGLQILFAADRSHHLQREILPQLKGGNIVVCDRYYWTSVAYGGVDFDMDWLWEINKNFLRPDLTIFLNIPPEVSLARIKKDRFSLEIFEDIKKLKKIKANYLKLIKKFPKSFVVINAQREKEEISQEIVRLIRKI